MSTINIKDIAKLAGVGVSTVSRVLNNQPDVKKSTKDKVLKIIEDYNYIPNNSARNLKRLKSNHIGVFVKGDYSSFFSDIIEIIEKEISKHGYSIVLHFHHGEGKLLESALQFSIEKKLIGLICLGGEAFNDEAVYMKQFNIPLIFGSTLIEQDLKREKFSSVMIDNKKAAYSAVKHLLSLNHKQIALISADDWTNSIAKVRKDAYKDAITDYGLQYDSSLIEYGNYSMQSGYDAMIKLLNKGVTITAVFAISDSMAIGAGKAARDKGLVIPEDISIIGFDGLEIGNFMFPTLTTIKQPTIEMGYNIINIMLRQIEDKTYVEHIVLDTELKHGESCLAYGG